MGFKLTYLTKSGVGHSRFVEQIKVAAVVATAIALRSPAAFCGRPVPSVVKDVSQG